MSEVAALPTQSSVMKTFMRTFTLLGCETWSLTRKEEHRLGVFGYSVLRKGCRF